MPIGSTRAQWDEGLRTVRQFNDLLRVLPPVPQSTATPAAPQAGARRTASPSRPLAPAGRSDTPQRHAETTTRDSGSTTRGATPPPARQEPSHRPPTGRNGHQASHHQR
jgi:hypothetical protein